MFLICSLWHILYAIGILALNKILLLLVSAFLVFHTTTFFISSLRTTNLFLTAFIFICSCCFLINSLTWCSDNFPHCSTALATCFQGSWTFVFVKYNLANTDIFQFLLNHPVLQNTPLVFVSWSAAFSSVGTCIHCFALVYSSILSTRTLSYFSSGMSRLDR